MAKVKVPYNDRVVDGSEVPIDESNERWTDLTLRDGTKLRVKVTVISAVRLDGEYDAAGHPTYLLNMTPVMVLMDVPDHLKKKRVSQ